MKESIEIQRMKQRKQWFENVSYEYGLSAVDDVRREQPAGSVESKYFKYGIIKADSLEGIDLNDEKSYAERNFSDKISLEDVYTNSVELSDEDQIVYTNGNFLTGGGVELMYSGKIHGSASMRTVSVMMRQKVFLFIWREMSIIRCRRLRRT